MDFSAKPNTIPYIVCDPPGSNTHGIHRMGSGFLPIVAHGGMAFKP